MKSIIKILYHRVSLIVAAILAQIFVLIAVIFTFNEYFVAFYWVSILISTIAVIWIINDKINPSYKIVWIIPIVLFPIFGGLFYLFFGGKKLSKKNRKKMAANTEKILKSLKTQSKNLDEIGEKNENLVVLSRYIQDYGFFPPFKNTISEYLPLGERKFERLKEELKKAERYIFLEYFIINEGVMWDSILDILLEKVRRGVEVRIIYDDFGCLLTLPYKYNEKLERMGIKCCVFNPIIPLLSTRINNRDHRKIVIIDGHTGFTGGINLADEYINEVEKHGHWKDAAIMLKGEAVLNMTVMFLSLWDYLKGIEEDYGRFIDNRKVIKTETPSGYYQPFADSPMDDEPVGETVYLNSINKAKKYIYITTPYLIVSNEMIKALISAAKGGVDVRIITPHHGDKWYVHAVTKLNYKVLVESGVKIYEYMPGFIHSKNLIVDNEYGVIGTINLDYRSFYLHFECGVWMYESPSLMEMKKDFLSTLKVCKEINIDDINNTKWHKLLIGSILRIFSPLM
ncbi:cardiolipin synthase [Herbivorax sp. ANBcel31]|uniref:cardiolipin synthase n=1 Tax=Herbivorax sp. ANBcel31 TaxID=3069754 RepID=UPI0027B06146|nr:cardiolipin synthase [Herbivorax sp. ANBcel31]MDQ2088090.1 cardiolipin synthase [Herbivorax sp. ANBcel31]